MSKQKTVLIACEYSGRVRRAFAAKGYHAISADILPADDKAGPDHYQGDVFDLLDTPEQWDLMIAFPPCTDLASSGARYFRQKRLDGRQDKALDFVQRLLDQPIKRIALENPIGVISSRIRKPDQIIQPWQFGHGETKSTCLWLKGLPKLEPTDIVEGRSNRIANMAPGPDRAKLRSLTYQGIADAMAEQWA